MKSGRNTWSNGKSALVVSVRGTVGLVASVYLAEILGFARLRPTVKATQDATFCILLPNPQNQGLPTPNGTGFFVSPDGWFVTAAHVVTENNRSDGPPRKDMGACWLQKETRIAAGNSGSMCQFVSLVYIDPATDFALLKVDFNKNANKDWLTGRTTFPHIEVSKRELEEGEPVYAFGYPLSESFAQQKLGMTIGATELHPRVTAAIVSSTTEKSKMLMAGTDPKVYVLDRALNYGNSGGPIVATETGKAHAFCSRFQPLFVPQWHLKDPQGQVPAIMTPSLYGIVSSLANPSIVTQLTKMGIAISDQ